MIFLSFWLLFPLSLYIGVLLGMEWNPSSKADRKLEIEYYSPLFYNWLNLGIHLCGYRAQKYFLWVPESPFLTSWQKSSRTCILHLGGHKWSPWCREMRNAESSRAGCRIQLTTQWTSCSDFRVFSVPLPPNSSESLAKSLDLVFRFIFFRKWGSSDNMYVTERECWALQDATGNPCTRHDFLTLSNIYIYIFFFSWFWVRFLGFFFPLRMCWSNFADVTQPSNFNLVALQVHWEMLKWLSRTLINPQHGGHIGCQGIGGQLFSSTACLVHEIVGEKPTTLRIFCIFLVFFVLRNSYLDGDFFFFSVRDHFQPWHNGTLLLVLTSKCCHNNNNSLWLLAHHPLITAAVRQSIRREQLPARKNKHNNTLWLVELESTLWRVPGKEGRAKPWHFTLIC